MLRNSAAERAGLRVGYAIVQVNDEDVLGQGDREVMEAVSRAFSAGLDVNLECLPRTMAEEFVEALHKLRSGKVCRSGMATISNIDIRSKWAFGA